VPSPINNGADNYHWLTGHTLGAKNVEKYFKVKQINNKHFAKAWKWKDNGKWIDAKSISVAKF